MWINSNILLSLKASIRLSDEKYASICLCIYVSILRVYAFINYVYVSYFLWSVYVSLISLKTLRQVRFYEYLVSFKHLFIQCWPRFAFYLVDLFLESESRPRWKCNGGQLFVKRNARNYETYLQTLQILSWTGWKFRSYKQPCESEWSYRYLK